MSLTTSEMTPADIRACTCGNDGYGNGGGMFGNDWAWIVILLLFGWGGRGFGGGFGGAGGGCSPCATQADVRSAVDQQTLISKMDKQTYGIADLGYSLANEFRGVDNAICSLGYNTQAGFNSIAAQLAQCCCDTRAAISDVKYTIASEGCDTRHAIYNSTRDIVDNANANSRAILDFLTQDKIATLTAENQALKFQASQTAQNAFITANQEAQTAELIRRLGRDCPVPAYVVPNPNCCYQYAQPACGCTGTF